MLLYGFWDGPGPNWRFQNARKQVSPAYIALGIKENAVTEAEIWGQTYLLYHSISMLQTNSTLVTGRPDTTTSRWKTYKISDIIFAKIKLTSGDSAR